MSRGISAAPANESLAQVIAELITTSETERETAAGSSETPHTHLGTAPPPVTGQQNTSPPPIHEVIGLDEQVDTKTNGSVSSSPLQDTEATPAPQPSINSPITTIGTANPPVGQTQQSAANARRRLRYQRTRTANTEMIISQPRQEPTIRAVCTSQGGSDAACCTTRIGHISKIHRR
jgi:hypothetical protein